MQVYYYGTYPRGPFSLISQAVKNEIMGETRMPNLGEMKWAQERGFR